MGRLIFILTFFLAGEISLSAQSRWTYSYTDSLTYSLYNSGKWKMVVDSSSAAIKSGTDFYYLRMRRGISFDNMGEYGNAVSEFEHALKFFPADTNSRAYIYSAEMEMGRRSEARMDGEKMSASEKNILHFKNPVVTQVGGWVGYSAFNTSLLGGAGQQGNQQGNQNINPETIQTSVYKNLYYGDLFLKNRIGQRLELTSEFSYLKFSQLEQFPPPPQMMGPHQMPKPTQFTSTGAQPGVDFSLNYLCSRKISVDASFLFTNTNSSSHKLLMPYSFQTEQHQINIFEYGIGASYHFAKADISARGYYLQTSDTGTVFQGSLLATFYPKANLNLYIKTNLSGVVLNSGFRPVGALLVGKKVAEHTWLDGEFLYGNLRYYTAPENNLLYNMADQTSWRISATLHLFLVNHLQIDFQYAYTSRNSAALSFYQGGAPTNTTFHYNSNQLTISSLWKF